MDALRAILHRNAIRFTRLDCVNDPDEGASSDMPATATTVFVSCWTAEVRESIPLWSLYAGGMGGVRIGFPAGFLAGQYINTGHFKREPITRLQKGVVIARRGGQMADVTPHVWGPARLLYADDEKRLRPKVHMPSRACRRYDLLRVGLIKKRYWSFEAEWRYRVFAVADGLMYPLKQSESDWVEQYVDLVNWPVDVRHIDVPLREGVWENVHIVMGPRANINKRREVESMLAHYDHGTEVSASSIRIR